jgi:hypothetical protein
MNDPIERNTLTSPATPPPVPDIATGACYRKLQVAIDWLGAIVCIIGQELRQPGAASQHTPLVASLS